MSLLPYQKIFFTSRLDPKQISDVLSRLVVKPNWDVSIDKVVHNRILEGHVGEKSFTIVMGRYGLTYGATSLLPVMKGTIKQNGPHGSKVKISIRPKIAGVLILGFFYLLIFLGFFFSISKALPQVFIVCCIFLAITYASLVSKFNKEVKVYKEIIQNHLNTNTN